MYTCLLQGVRVLTTEQSLQQEVLAHEAAERLLRYFEPRALESTEGYCHARDLMATFLSRLEDSYRAHSQAILETTPTAAQADAAFRQVPQVQNTMAGHGEAETVTATYSGGPHPGEDPRGQHLEGQHQGGHHPGYRTY